MQTTNNLSATVVSIGAKGCKHIVLGMFQLFHTLLMCQLSTCGEGRDTEQ